MEVLKNVLIKEIDGAAKGDKVFLVDNLPKNLLYHKVIARQIDPMSPTGDRLVPEYMLGGNGQRLPTGRMMDELRPGIEMSGSGDGAYCFFTQYLEAQYRLRDIDNYIKANLPVLERIPEREYYASQPGLMTSGTRPLDTLPRVVLPDPVSPPAAQATVQAGTPTSVSAPDTAAGKIKKARKPMTEEQKQAARERLALARAKKVTLQQPAQ